MNSFTIAWNMIKRTIGSRKGILAHVIVPCIVIAGLTGLLGRDDISKAEIAYINEDQGVVSQYLLDLLKKQPEYVLKSFTSEKEMKDYLISMKGNIGLTIPAGFSEGVKNGNVPNLRIYEMKISEPGVMIKLNINNLMRGTILGADKIYRSADGELDKDATFSALLDEIQKHSIHSVTSDLRLYPKPGISTITGFTLIFLMGLVGSTVSIIVEDRANRTMARMFTAPVRAWEITMGNFLGSFFVGLIQIAIILTLSRTILHYDYGIALLPHLLILSAFMLVSMGLACTVAGLIRNPQNTGTLNSLIIMPTSMIGGCFWPARFMPDFLQKLSNFVPQKWAIQGVESLSAGTGMNSLVHPMLVLGLMAVILLGIGSAILRPHETNTGM